LVIKDLKRDLSKELELNKNITMLSDKQGELIASQGETISLLKYLL
jgi:hypothetical protein